MCARGGGGREGGGDKPLHIVAWDIKPWGTHFSCSLIRKDHRVILGDPIPTGCGSCSLAWCIGVSRGVEAAYHAW